jgi:shikimate 5-dehydrogenase
MNVTSVGAGLGPDAGINEEVTMSDRNKRTSRRNFLLTLGAGGAATAAALVAKQPQTDASNASSKGKRATRGYHVTEHVNDYYRTAKV